MQRILLFIGLSSCVTFSAAQTEPSANLLKQLKTLHTDFITYLETAPCPCISSYCAGSQRDPSTWNSLKRRVETIQTAYRWENSTSDHVLNKVYHWHLIRAMYVQEELPTYDESGSGEFTWTNARRHIKKARDILMIGNLDQKLHDPPCRPLPYDCDLFKQILDKEASQEIKETYERLFYQKNNRGGKIGFPKDKEFRSESYRPIDQCDRILEYIKRINTQVRVRQDYRKSTFEFLKELNNTYLNPNLKNPYKLESDRHERLKEISLEVRNLGWDYKKDSCMSIDTMKSKVDRITMLIEENRLKTVEELSHPNLTSSTLGTFLDSVYLNEEGNLHIDLMVPVNIVDLEIGEYNSPSYRRTLESVKENDYERTWVPWIGSYAASHGGLKVQFCYRGMADSIAIKEGGISYRGEFGLINEMIHCLLHLCKIYRSKGYSNIPIVIPRQTMIKNNYELATLRAKQAELIFRTMKKVVYPDKVRFEAHHYRCISGPAYRGVLIQAVFLNVSKPDDQLLAFCQSSVKDLNRMYQNILARKPRD